MRDRRSVARFFFPFITDHAALGAWQTTPAEGLIAPDPDALMVVIRISQALAQLACHAWYPWREIVERCRGRDIVVRIVRGIGSLQLRRQRERGLSR
jgi:hypothetical protein